MSDPYNPWPNLTAYIKYAKEKNNISDKAYSWTLGLSILTLLIFWWLEASKWLFILPAISILYSFKEIAFRAGREQGFLDGYDIGSDETYNAFNEHEV